MKLRELAHGLIGHRIIGDGDIEIGRLRMDSRQVGPGELFVCVPEVPYLKFRDSHQFAADAAGRGASAILAERELDVAVPTLLVRDARYAMAYAACRLYGYPSRSLRVIGVTGTNGKTTTSHIIEHLLADNGHQAGMMGNFGLKIGGATSASDWNTQESCELQRSFRRIVDAGARYCVMEVSSHGLALGRVLGTDFRTGVFTNLTQDHLDFHRTMKRYRAAKGLLFSRLGNAFGPSSGDAKYAVLNADDDASSEYRDITAAQTVTYGIKERADIRASDIAITSRGTKFHISGVAGEAEVKLPLVGAFNVSNALAAIAAVWLEGVPLARIAPSLERMAIVEGRMEPVDEGQPFAVLVDYSHTPDGLENALATIRGFAERRVITVFGCGGDRDRAKRPIMGEIAASYSDYVIVTSDNPRTEDPEAILREIEPGVRKGGGDSPDRYSLLADRRAAIEKAVEMASPGDVVLIAGKGHETVQIVQGTAHHFDDREEARIALRGRIG